jgi:hypothetical protein
MSVGGRRYRLRVAAPLNRGTAPAAPATGSTSLIRRPPGSSHSAQRSPEPRNGSNASSNQTIRPA